MASEINLTSQKTFEFDFPPVAVGPRNGLNARTQDDTDCWSLRRVVEILLSKNLLVLPARLRRIPATSIGRTPDFEICTKNHFGFIELTEATSSSDQREMSQSEFEDTSLIGQFGGRGLEGYSGNDAELEIAQDIHSAVSRKAVHYENESFRQLTILGIYVNSNPMFALQRLERVRPFLDETTLLKPRFKKLVIFTDSSSLLV